MGHYFTHALYSEPTGLNRELLPEEIAKRVITADATGDLCDLEGIASRLAIYPGLHAEEAANKVTLYLIDRFIERGWKTGQDASSANIKIISGSGGSVITEGRFSYVFGDDGMSMGVSYNGKAFAVIPRLVIVRGEGFPQALVAHPQHPNHRLKRERMLEAAKHFTRLPSDVGTLQAYVQDDFEALLREFALYHNKALHSDIRHGVGHKSRSYLVFSATRGQLDEVAAAAFQRMVGAFSCTFALAREKYK